MAYALESSNGFNRPMVETIKVGDENYGLINLAGQGLLEIIINIRKMGNQQIQAQPELPEAA